MLIAGTKTRAVRALVAKARVNQAAINYHFGGKGGLYREVLRAAMRSPHQPMQRRMNAAKERAQYRYPKLGVVATTTMNADTFAEMLDRAIQRSQVKLIEHRQDEGAKSPSPAPIPSHGTPRTGPTTDRRFRRG